MNELEDEPQDVQDARPVEEAIREGMVDKLKEPTGIKSDLEDSDDEDDEDADEKPCRPKAPKRFECRKSRPVKKDCFIQKKRKNPKGVTVWVHEKPCKLKKEEFVPRKCFTHEEYLKFLSSPKKYCQSGCARKPELRKFKVLKPRIIELARPTRRHVEQTLMNYGCGMPPHQLESLIETLDDINAMTPEQVEAYFKQQKKQRRRKAELKRKRKMERMPCFQQPKKKCDAGEPCLDEEAVTCMYSMALRFVKALLAWKCCIPREDYKDIAEVILERLAKIMCYEPIGDEDRKSQQMRLLADVVSCWMADILMAVADKKKDELLQECKEPPLDVGSLLQPSDEGTLYFDATGEENSFIPTTVYSDDDTNTAAGDYEEEDWSESSLGVVTVDVAVGEDDDGESIEIVGSEQGNDKEMQTDVGEEKAVETEEIEEIEEVEKTELEIEVDRLQKSCSRMFGTDLPFLTFARLFETLFCLIDCVSETTLQCPLDNRIHRAIFLKLEEAARLENPNQVTKRLQDVMDVIAGKLAKFVRQSLKEAEVNFLEDYQAQVESKELRDWSKRLAEMTSVVEDWSGWLEKTICEACKLRSKKGITRGEWWEWTSKFETNAMLWRRAYLESIHDEHHDLAMICGREVCKAGEAEKLPCHASEVVMRNTSFASCKKYLDRELFQSHVQSQSLSPTSKLESGSDARSKSIAET